MTYGREQARARNGSQAGYRSSGARASAIDCRVASALARPCGLLVLFLAVVKLLEHQLSACAAPARGRGRWAAWIQSARLQYDASSGIRHSRVTAGKCRCAKAGSKKYGDWLRRSGAGLLAAALRDDGGREFVRCPAAFRDEAGRHRSRCISAAIAVRPVQRLDRFRLVATRQRGPSAERLYAGRIIRRCSPARDHGYGLRRGGRLPATVALRYFVG